MGFKNPFVREHMPDHMQAEKKAFNRWRAGSIFLMAVSAILALALTPLLWHIAKNPFSFQTWSDAVGFFSLIGQWKLLHIHLLFAQSFGPGPFSVLGGTLFAYCLCVLVAIIPSGILALMNPHDNIAYKQGMANWADDKVLADMEADKKIGIKGGFVMALGRWPTGKRKGQMVQMIETLSLLCLAPPGTGKTAALVVPTIVDSDTTSFIVNDPKPELWEFTSHYRSEVSHVFMLNWSSTDQPNYIFTFDREKDADFWTRVRDRDFSSDAVPAAVLEAASADSVSPIVTVAIHPARFQSTVDWLGKFSSPDIYSYEAPTYYPRFNFLSPRLVPPIGPARDTYLDAIAQTLIEDKKGGDTYFINKGRAALTGFMHLIVAKVGDAGDYEGIPANWKDHEPSLPMLVDWITLAQFKATGDDADGEDNIKDPNIPKSDPNADKVGEWLRKITKSIQYDPEFPADHKNNIGKTNRGFMDLAPLVDMADKERSGIIGTMSEALIPFNNEAVKQRTSSCDFISDDLRGVLDPEITARTKLPANHKDYLSIGSKEYLKLEGDVSNWKPITLYVCINQADAPAFAKITSLLYEVLSRDLLSYAPRTTNSKTGTRLGFSPTCFAMDEFAKLKKIQAVMEGPDLGRSKKVMYLFAAQDFGQIEKTYSKEDIEVIISTTAIKYILAQNNPTTIERLQKIVGQTTIRDRNRSGMEGLSKQANPLAANVSEQTSGVNFLRTEDIAALPANKVIIIAQGFSNRPMKLDAARYFEDPILSAKVYPGAERVKPGTVHPRTPGPNMYLPKHLYEARLREEIDRRNKMNRRHVKQDTTKTFVAANFNGVPIAPNISSVS